MNTKTVLTGEQINEAWRNNLKGVVMSGDQVRNIKLVLALMYKHAYNIVNEINNTE